VPADKPRGETGHYQEIAQAAVRLLADNFPAGSNFEVHPLIGEVRTQLRSLLAKTQLGSAAADRLAEEIQTLDLDISLFVRNPANDKFELIIFEVKKTSALGLAELSQLIGYSLVAKNHLNVLINVDHGIGSRLVTLLETDPDLTTITQTRQDGVVVKHEVGIMLWRSDTLDFNYTDTGAIASMPQLAGKIAESLR
jgi:hypothetical protein